MFEYEGGQYTIQDLKAQADKRGMDFEEFMQKMYGKGMTQAKDTSEGQALNLDMSSQQSFGQKNDGFDDDMSIMQGFKNLFGTNIGNMWTKRVLDIKGSAATFFEDFSPDIGQAIIGSDGKDRGAMGLIDPETGRLVTMDEDAWRSKGYDAQENKRWNELVERRDKLKHPRHWKNLGYNSLGEFEKSEDGEELMALEYFYENGEKTSTVFAEAAQENLYKSLKAVEGNLRTMDKGVTGFTDALKKGEIDDMFVQSVDFLTNTTIDMGLAAMTRGVSMAAQMYGSSYTTYNNEKSKLLYGEDDPDRFKKLIENDEDEMATPGLLAGVGYIMERAGYKGITKEIMKKSFGGKKALNLLIAGNKEGLTEYGQGLTERLNENLGKGMSLEEGVIDVGRYMGTEEAWDQYFAGLIGGGGLATGGSIVQGALRSDENSNVFINKTINNIAALNEMRHRTSNKKEQKRLLDLIQIEQTELKGFLQTNKDLSDYLVEGEVDILTDLVNNRRDVTSDVVKLQNLLKRNKISEQSYNDQAKILKDKLADLDSDLKMIKENANMRLLKSDLDAGSAFLGNVDGLEQDVYDTPAEFFAALEQEYKAQGKKMPNFEGVNIHGLKIGNKFLINAKVAAEVNAVATSTHEVLHGIVKSTVQADDGTGHLSAKGEIIVNSFISQLSSKEKGLIEGLLKNGKYKVNEDGTDKDFKEYGEEYLTMYAQLAKEGKFTKNNIQKAGVWFGRFFNKETEFKKISFKDGKSTKAFLDAYAGGNKVALEQSVALAKEGVKMKETPEQFSKDSKGPVDSLGKMGWTDKTWKESGAKFAIETMKDEKLLDALIYTKYKVEDVPANFVDLVYAELVKDVQKFNEGKWGTKDENNSLFGYLQGRIKFRAGDVYNREFKVDPEMKGAKDIGKTTKEGEVKVQVAAEKSSEMEAFEEEDLSIQGQAKKAKADKQQYSEYRRKLGFETGSKIYNEVLENVKKSLMIAYSTTQGIADVQLRSQAIAAKLKQEYANLNSPLFKQIKNFLTYGIADTKVPYGTKDTYISNLKKLREDIVKNTSTADLVQMERNTPEADRIFTDFVKVLTSIDQVRDAVNREQLPPDALNKITKDKKTGKGAFSPSLYNKIMPTETELVSWADQPGKNPITGLKQGLKGTRKDGLAMRMVNSLVTDAIMEARQSDQVQDRIAGMEIDPGSVAELGAAIGREVNVKFSKSNAIEDISAAMNGSGSVNVYSQIKFSKSHREAYEKQLTKRRPDLTEKQRKGAVQSVFDFVDGKDIPNHLKSKYEKMAMHYTANGFLILPEDGYKVIEAERLASIKNLDPFSFKNPNVLIEKYVDQVKGTRTNPDNVKTFSNKTQLTNGVTVYDVEDSKQGQIDSRKVIDTHFGKKANPWCLLARDTRTDQRSGNFKTKAEAKQFADEYKAKGWKVETFYMEQQSEYEVYADLMSNKETELDGAFEMWKSYNNGGNGFKIAFQNGKLIAFRDGGKIFQWWDRMDRSSKGIMIRGKKAADGFTPTIELDGSKETITGYEKGKNAWQQENGSYTRKDIDGNLVESHTKVNGKFVGERIAPGSEGSVTIDTFKDGVMVKRVQDSTKEMQLFTSGYDVRIGADKITVYDLTKWKSTTTGDNVALMDGENKKVEVIEGTVMNMALKISPESYDRYRGMQGEKVRIVKTRVGPNTGNYNDISSVTINGVEQDIRAKFSKSAENNVKFFLTSRQEFILLPSYVNKKIKALKEKENITAAENQVLDILEVAQGLYDMEAVEVYNTLVEQFPSIFNNLQESDFKNQKSFIAALEKNNQTQMKVNGYVTSKKVLQKQTENLSIEKGVELIAEYLTNVGRDVRSALIVKTNKGLKIDLIDTLQDGRFEKYFKAEETFKGSGKYKIVYAKDGKNFENVEIYESVEDIKNNIRKDKSLVETVNKQAEKSQEYRLKTLNPKNKDLTLGDKFDFIELTNTGTKGSGRKAAKIDVTVTDKSNLIAEELVLEHEITIKNMKSYERAYAKGDISKEQMKEVYQQNKVHVLPKSYKSIFKKLDAKTGKIKPLSKGALILKKLGIKQGVDDVLALTGKASQRQGMGYESITELSSYFESLFNNGLINKMPESLQDSFNRKSNSFKNAVQFSRSANNPTKGITVLDFDDTLATSKSLIRFTRPDGTKGTLNAEQYASTYENLSELGYKFDFSEFTKVVDGKTAPLFNKAMKLQGKFGPESMFVLTARPAESAGAIHAFLKANGLNIPLKNITGLANSTAEAKALWMAEKVGEGYNDFYFADDALQNVKAVKNMLNQFDVKSKVQQARVKFSKSMDEKFNDILENVTGIGTEKRFSEIKGRKRGDDKGKFRLFIPPSHEDFIGLLYNFMGKGREGDKHRDFFEQALVRPINRAYREIDAAKQAIANDYKALNKKFPEIKDKLIKTTPDGDFTFSDAIRVYLWNKHGHKIPGLTETDQASLTELVKSDPQLQAYAETLNMISKQETYVAPGQSWEMGNIRIDLVDATGRVGRAEYFAEYQENAEIIFSEENLNKIEAAYGKDFRSALEDMLHRIKTGVNRPKGASAKPNMFMNWLNASVAGVMFFNTRSALLQQMSNVNYLNFADNNIYAAGKAFANQPQYWKDFAMIFNSDMLKQRRGGLGTDINGAELAEAIKKARPDSMFDQVAIITGKALKLGFLPTQIGDNIAIATGGAAFYRNRVNKYIKDGMSIKEAENAAFTDFQNITQSTQQSARPDMTSQQQASWMGKIILNFLNTPSQYNRIIKKAALDIKNRRITGPNTSQMQSDMSNMSRILYYGAAQNLIFYTLQTALFAVMFGDDEDEEAYLKKKERVIHGTIDTILRGSGIYGVAISTLKNMFIKFMEQREAEYNKDESAVVMELANFSPVLGIKFRRIVNAEKTINYNGKVIEEMETFDLDNPAWSAVTNYTQSLTGAPVNKIYQKTINLRNAADNQYTALQRILFLSGYTTWSLNLGDTDKMKKIKEDIKSEKKKNKNKKSGVKSYKRVKK
jgi:hypothetical protein